MNDIREVALSASPVFGWVRTPGVRRQFSGEIWYEFDRRGFFTADSPQLMDPATPRVVFVGDSNTFGYGVRTEASFVEVADARLDGVNAINLGVPGYSSYQGLRVVREHLRELQPRVVVVSFNFNDRRLANTPDGPEWTSALYRVSDAYPPMRIRRWLLRHSDLTRLMDGGLRAVGAIQAAEDPAPVLYRADEATPRVSESAYVENLALMADEIRRHGATPVFMLLRDNPEVARPLRDAVARLDGGDPATAIRELESLIDVEESEYLVLAHLYLGQALLAAGEAQLAEEVLATRFGTAEMDGGDPVRLDVAYNELMREVAATAGVEVVDAAALLDPHEEFFLDLAHFNEEGHRLVGELVASTIAPLFQ